MGHTIRLMLVATRALQSLTITTLIANPAFAESPPLIGASNRDSAKVEYFEKRIRPLLIDNCYNCHSADNGGKGGLRVDDRNGLIEGGGRGPGISPGKPAGSLLIKAVRHQSGLEMPPKKQLTEEQINDLEKWIADGAVWPAAEVPEGLIGPKPEYEKRRKDHWAWQPLNDSSPPRIDNSSFAFNEIDQFILAKLNENRLQPVSDADKPALIRRVTFDLTGLPPIGDEIANFLADTSPEAYEKVVDRLLKSPAFGERWARHWLDIARYGESTGSARNLPMPHAWRYRDYVINAFTNDKPYNQFIREQIAGDLLPANSVEEKAEQLIATGFLAIGVKDVNQRFKIRYIMDNVDEQIDTVSRSILGLTASCARCHDHKFDPIPTVDYYALAGIFQSSDLCAGLRSKMGGGGLDYYDSSLLLHVGPKSKPSPEIAQKIEEQTKVIAIASAEFEAIRGTPDGAVLDKNGQSKEQAARENVNKAERELSVLNDPANFGDIAYGVRDSQRIADTEIRIRGEAEQQGPRVPRGFLSVLSFSDQPKINSKQSGRLELADWLTSERNPLTQRVIVNRIWQHLFSKGIVLSVDNFGVTGDRPSHPELLDFLARSFTSNGWSVKKLVRMIVLSHSYRLSSDNSEANTVVDPSNRLIWQHTPRRLEAEEIRDAMLVSSGKLNRRRPETSPSSGLKVIEIQNNGIEARRLIEATRTSVFRSLYLPLVRGIAPRSLEVFDFADQGLVTGTRDSTTVPTQALYLMNDPFVREQALGFAERLLQNVELNDTQRIIAAYQIALCRSPSLAEIDQASRHIAAVEAIVRESNLANSQASVDFQNSPVDPAGTLLAGSQNGATAVRVPSESSIASGTPKSNEGSSDDKPIDTKGPKTTAWTSFCQALFGAAEFRFLN